jgi:multisubunit Na+/H+ antiporter MnhG subunit
MFRIIGADGREYGPVSADQLREWIAQGRASASTRARAEDSLEWRSLGSFPEFSSSLAASALPPLYRPAANRKTNGFAITGLVLGVLALTAGWCCCYGFPFNVIGVIFSIAALAQIRRNPELYEGQALAVTGLIFSILSILLAVIVIIFFGALAVWEEVPRRVYRL